MTGWVNEAGCAQLNPILTLQETSTSRLPAVKEVRSSSVRKIRGQGGILMHAVDDDVGNRRDARAQRR